MFEAFDFTAVAEIDAQVATNCMSAPDSRISKHDLRVLCEVGVLALAIERGDAALPIFELLDIEQPENAAGSIGIAMVEVSQGNEKSAFARLRRAITSKRRCVREAKAVLAVFLMGFGRHAEAKILRREVLRGPDCGAKRLLSSYGVA